MESFRPGTAPTELRRPEAVAALRNLLGDDGLVHTVASSYATWAAFAAATAAERAHLFGNRVIDIPAAPPPVPVPPPGVAVLTRYDERYPVGLLEHTQPPAMLYVAGTLPRVPMLAVVGASNPTSTGVEISRAAALAALAQQVPVVVPLTLGCATAAARTVLDVGGKLVVVVAHGFGVGSSQQALLDSAVAAGGAVVSPFTPQTQISETNNDHAGSVAALIASAVVLAEVGPVAGAAQAPTATAVRAGRYLISPKPPAAPESGRYIPPSAFGTAVFASPREWSDDYFGSSPRIAQRCANGLTPADAVVANPADIAVAVALGCAPRAESHRL